MRSFGPLWWARAREHLAPPLRAHVQRLLRKPSACREYVHMVEFLVCPQSCECVAKSYNLVVSSLIAATKVNVGVAAQCVFNFLTLPCGSHPDMGSCAVTVRQFLRWYLWRKSHCQIAKFSILMLPAGEQWSSLPIDCGVIFFYGHGILDCSWQMSRCSSAVYILHIQSDIYGSGVLSMKRSSQRLEEDDLPERG